MGTQKKRGPRPCDHSDGQRFVVPGRNSLTPDELRSPDLYKVSVIAVEYPPHAGRIPDFSQLDTHDFAMYILQEPVRFTSRIRPACLPKQDANHQGMSAVAAGWGRFMIEQEGQEWTSKQSPVLRRVDLRVSKKKYDHFKMFGTELRKDENGVFEDPCAGDSGGPLMYKDRSSYRWTLIGTLHGAALNCKTGRVAHFEGSTDGIWNKVSFHTDWITEKIKQAETHETEANETQTRQEIHVNPNTVFIPQQWMLRSQEEKSRAKPSA